MLVKYFTIFIFLVSTFIASAQASHLRDRIIADRNTLATNGKEAFLDQLFTRLELDLARARRRLDAKRARSLERGVRDTQARLSAMSARELDQALGELDDWLAQREGHASLLRRPGGWVERFFGDTVLVRNFLVSATTLSALGTCAGIAAVTCSATPLVAALGPLIGVIALLNAPVLGSSGR